MSQCRNIKNMRNNSGFTIVELIIIMAIIGILAAVAVPNFLSILPDSRLKSASRDLYSNLQLARIGAIKNNRPWAIVFNTGAGQYQVFSDDGDDSSWTGTADNTLVRTVTLSDYGSGITYGQGSATTDIDGGGFAGVVTYAGNVAQLNSRGTADSGYVYLINSKNTTCYGVGTRTSGVVILRRWSSGGWTD